MSRDQSGSCLPFETPVCEWQCSFLLASSHHHHHMNFYYIFLLLLVVLSAYSESSQGEPPDPLDCTLAAVCPNSSSDPLGVLAPVLPQSWVLGPVLSQNMVLPQNEVPQSWVFESVFRVGCLNLRSLDQCSKMECLNLSCLRMGCLKLSCPDQQNCFYVSK
jgi:hypothetical protein